MKVSRITLAVTIFIVQMVAFSLVYAECGSGDRADRSVVLSWIDSKIIQMQNKTFVSETHDDKGCKIRRIMTFGNYSRSNHTMNADYRMQACNGRNNAAILEIKPRIIKDTGSEVYEANIPWFRLFTQGMDLEGVALKDETDDGRVCFLPGGRISILGDVYHPQ